LKVKQYILLKYLTNYVDIIFNFYHPLIINRFYIKVNGKKEGNWANQSSK